MDKPYIIINFKDCPFFKVESLTTKLKEIHSRIRHKVRLILAIQAADFKQIIYKTPYDVFVHDIKSIGTGSLDVFLDQFDARKDHGMVKGVILNHPENRLSEESLDASFRKAKHRMLETIVCTSSIEEGQELEARYQPTAIGIESRELIGKNESFTNCYPNLVKDAKTCIANDVLIGGGIRSQIDFQKVILDGGSGVLVTSVVLNATRPEIMLESWANAVTYKPTNI